MVAGGGRQGKAELGRVSATHGIVGDVKAHKARAQPVLDPVGGPIIETDGGHGARHRVGEGWTGGLKKVPRTTRQQPACRQRTQTEVNQPMALIAWFPRHDSGGTVESKRLVRTRSGLAVPAAIPSCGASPADALWATKATASRRAGSRSAGMVGWCVEAWSVVLGLG